MKKWFLICTMTALITIVSGTNLFFYFDQTSDLKEVKEQVSLLDERYQHAQEQFKESISYSGGLYNRIDEIETSIGKLQSSYENYPILKDGLEELTTGIEEIRQQLLALNLEHVSAAQVVEGAEPFVVYIQASLGGYQVSGSGVIVSSSGYIITNYHVVEGMKNLSVTLHSGETLSTKLVEYDAGRDVAVLKLASDGDDFPFAPLGNSDTLLVGSDVLAIGYPYPLGDFVPGRASVTRGIISAVRRIDGYKYIQTDTAINPGNSGGALLNFNGELVGVNVAKYVDVDIEGIGLAIPINEIKNMINDF